ncbi:type II toxin-antitoxin system HicA family toxin [Rhizobium sp.]
MGSNNRLEAMRRNPAGDWKIADVEVACRQHSVDCLPNRAGGSHYKISHASQREILTLPFKRPVKAIYIRKLVAFIDAVRTSK